MSYPFIASAGLGSSKAGSTITATVTDLAGVALVSQPTRTVVNLGGGVFGLSVPDMADAQTGWVLLQESGTTLAAIPVSPRESENADVKTSSRSTYAGAGTIGALPADGTAVLSLTQFSAINPAGSAIVAQSTGGDGMGLEIRGAGAGHGIFAQGGDNADGVRLRGGTTSGAGLTLQPLGIGPGLNIQASSDNAVKIGGDTGYAAVAVTSYGSGEVLSLHATGTGHGVSIQAGTGGHDVALIGDGTIWDGVNARLVSAIAADLLPAAVTAVQAALTAQGYTTARATKVDNLDAAVSTRSTYAGGDTSGTTTLLSRLTAPRATGLDNLDAAVSTRSTLTASQVDTQVFAHAIDGGTFAQAIVAIAREAAADVAESSDHTTTTFGQFKVAGTAVAGITSTNSVTGRTVTVH